MGHGPVLDHHWSLGLTVPCQTEWSLNFGKGLGQAEGSQAAFPRSAIGNVSGYRCMSDCRSRGREFDPGPGPYFRGD